jgi:hypothetical protein
MGQPVKLSDAFVLDARIAGAAQERSIAGQVEFWAKLGRSVESMLEGRQVLAMRRSGEAQSLTEALASVDTPAGRKRVEDVLAGRPYPHYKQYAGEPGLLLRVDEDGRETVGRFVNRVFTAVEKRSGSPSKPLGASKPNPARKGLRTESLSAGASENLATQSKRRPAWA